MADETPAKPTYVDASNVVEAHAMVVADEAANDYFWTICAGLYPDNLKVFDYLALRWVVDNEAVLRSSRAYRAKEKIDSGKAAADALDLVRRAFSETSPESLGNRCLAYFASVESGAQKVATKTPAVKTLLSEFVPSPTPKSDETTFLMGCMRTGYNANWNFGFASAYCDCAYDVMSDAFSAKDWNAYAKAIEREESATDLKQVKRVKPELEKCAANLVDSSSK